MTRGFKKGMSGYTIVELMVTIVIVSILAATVGMFVVNLLTIQENEREEAYIREKLVDVSGTLADMMSIGSSIEGQSTGQFCTDPFNVLYRRETGGVSLETGRVTRVSELSSYFLSPDSKQSTALGLIAHSIGVYTNSYSRVLRGDDTPLIPLNNFKEIKILDDGKVDLSYALSPLKIGDGDETSLWFLRLRADYEVEDKKGNCEHRDVVVERIIRLWNWTGDGVL